MNNTENLSEHTSTERHHTAQSERNSIPMSVLNKTDEQKKINTASESKYVCIISMPIWFTPSYIRINVKWHEKPCCKKIFVPALFTSVAMIVGILIVCLAKREISRSIFNRLSFYKEKNKFTEIIRKVYCNIFFKYHWQYNPSFKKNPMYPNTIL